MNAKFLLSNGENNRGPFSVEEISNQIESGLTQWTEFYFDEAKKDWVMLFEHPQLEKLYDQSRMNLRNSISDRSNNKKAELNSSAEEALKNKTWFILKDSTKYGPFSRLELVQMLQEKTLFEFDQVWGENYSEWKTLSDVDEFKPDSIKALKESGQVNVNEVFFRRRYPRARYGCTLVAHDSKAVFKGKSYEISASGAGILLQENDLKMGQTLFLHFKPGIGVPPFNAVCQVVSKISTEESGIYKYGVKFTTITQTMRDSIKDYAAKAS